MTKHMEIDIRSNPRVRNFRNWLAKAPVGARYVYHTGQLAQDRAIVIGELVFPHQPDDLIADMALAASEHGAVYLMQRRVGVDNFDYIAIKRRNA